MCLVFMPDILVDSYHFWDSVEQVQQNVSGIYARYTRRFISFLGQCGTGSTECVKYLCQIYP